MQIRKMWKGTLTKLKESGNTIAIFVVSIYRQTLLRNPDLMSS